jgi:hypothetical protein
VRYDIYIYMPLGGKGIMASTSFEHLFTHRQEVLYIQKLVYFVCIMSVGCYQGWSGN